MNKQKLYSLLHQAYELEFSGNYKQADILDNMIRTSAGVGFLEGMLKDIAKNANAYSNVLKDAGLVAEDVKLLESLPEAEKALITTTPKAIEKIKELKALEATRAIEGVEEASKFKENIDRLRGTARGVGEKVKGVGEKVRGVGQRAKGAGSALRAFYQRISTRLRKLDKFYERISAAFEQDSGLKINETSVDELREAAKRLGLRRNPVYRMYLEFKENISNIKKEFREGYINEAGETILLTADEKVNAVENAATYWEKAGFDKKYVKTVLQEGSVTLEGFKDAYKPLQTKPGFKVFYTLAIAGAGTAVGVNLLGEKNQESTGGGSATAPANATNSGQPPAAQETSQPSQQSLLTERLRQRQDTSEEAILALKPLITSTPQRLGPTTPLGQIYVYLKDKVSERAANSAILKLRAENEKNNWGLNYSGRDSEIGQNGYDFIRSY